MHFFSQSALRLALYRFCCAVVTFGVVGLAAFALAGESEWVNAGLSVIPWICAVAALWFSPANRWSNWASITCRFVGRHATPILATSGFWIIKTEDSLSDRLGNGLLCFFLAILCVFVGFCGSLGAKLSDKSDASHAS